MTRKRYIKLCMALGVSRNAANRMAKAEQDGKVPYAESWQYINAHHRVPYLADIDEMHDTGDSRLAGILEAGMAAKPGPVIVINSGTWPENWRPRFDWPPQPHPAAGCLYAIDTTPKEEPSEQWPKLDQHLIDMLDALRYAVEAVYNQQRGVLGR